MSEDQEVEYLGDPMAHLQIPIFDSFDVASRKVVAVLDSLIHWRALFQNVLNPNIDGITVVLEDGCAGVFTFEINGESADIVGAGDLHDSKFQNYKRESRFNTTSLDDGTETGLKFNQLTCAYSISVYPTKKYQNSFTPAGTIIMIFAVVMVFIFAIAMFLVYDYVVEIRQSLILAHATQTTAIVSSLFPKNVRDRLMQAEAQPKGLGRKGSHHHSIAPTHRLKTYLNGYNGDNENGQPIADLFPHCTVFFADIEGFTAWSSTREPAQVFVLLQTVYQAFDTLAKRRKVFKVETIGDSYVAVTGLPDPQVRLFLMLYTCAIYR